MKLIEIIKKNGMLLVAGLAVIGFSSFKMIEKLNPPQSGWYSIDATSSNTNDTDKQTIEFREGTSTPTGPNCNLTNSNLPCQVHLDLSNFESDDLIEGMTVEEAELAGAVIGNYAKRP